MRNCIAVGCDLHDQSMLLMIAHNEGEPQKRSSGTHREARRKMIEYLKRCQREAGADQIVFAYEASQSGYVLYDELTAAGVECHVLAPSKMPHTAKSRRNKTDEKDGRRNLDVLRAHVWAGNELPETWVPDAETREDRALVRARVSAGEKRASCRREIRSVLKRNDVVKPAGLGKGWSQKYQAWLLGLTSVPSVLGRGERVVMASLLRQLEALQKEVEILDAEVLALSKTERYREVVAECRRLKGVGVLTAMVFLTETGDPLRFKNRRSIGNFMGLTPSSDESGEASDRKGHITHQGPWRARRVLNQAAHVRVRTDPEEKAWFGQWLAKHPKKKNIGIVAAMRRLSIRLWHAACRVARERAGLPPLPSPRRGEAPACAPGT